MNVSHLRKHLADLAALLDAAGVGKKVDDLRAVGDAMALFPDVSLTEFSGFLTRAKGYLDRGEVPMVEPKKTGRAPAAPKPSPALESATRRIRDLYAAAGQPSTTTDMIRAARADLEPLTLPQIKEVAKAIDAYIAATKKKAEAIAAIVNHILDRKSGSVVAGMSER